MPNFPFSAEELLIIVVVGLAAGAALTLYIFKDHL